MKCRVAWFVLLVQVRTMRNQRLHRRGTVLHAGLVKFSPPLVVKNIKSRSSLEKGLQRNTHPKRRQKEKREREKREKRERKERENRGKNIKP